jgi:hypothetical protein
MSNTLARAWKTSWLKTDGVEEEAAAMGHLVKNAGSITRPPGV